MNESSIDVARRLIHRVFDRVHRNQSVGKSRRDNLKFRGNVEDLECRIALSLDIAQAEVQPAAPPAAWDANLAPDWINVPVLLGGLAGAVPPIVNGPFGPPLPNMAPAPAAPVGNPFPLFPGGPMVGPVAGIEIPPQPVPAPAPVAPAPVAPAPVAPAPVAPAPVAPAPAPVPVPAPVPAPAPVNPVAPVPPNLADGQDQEVIPPNGDCAFSVEACNVLLEFSNDQKTIVV